ncbi:right-handed parallel beta-helix repeat-containing protein [Bacillus spongiae]|uniref:Right-handed parallel beta-helix repeat-containing protein n=1 Tax=Bacillus spongiae TaxID=2683610 RepID=A0ABU8HFI3_9BACI
MSASKRNSFFLIAIVFTTLFFLTILTVIGIIIFNEKTIVVPDEEDTISGAVGMADPGDIILVNAKEDGTPYEEEVMINKENIKLIGTGKEQPELDGTGFLNGITIEDTSRVLVKNFMIRDYSGEGIFLDNSTKNMIIENIVIGNGGDSSLNAGIRLMDADENIIKKNKINDNVEHGIRSFNSTSNMIKENTVNGNINQEGIHLILSNNDMITDNIINVNDFIGILIEDSSNIKIKRNTANNNGEFGIVLFESNDSLVYRNIANNNGDGIGDGNGITINESNRNAIIKNSTNLNSIVGIDLEDGSIDNDVFFNKAFSNGMFDIIDEDGNNHKGNECNTSNPPGLCN